MRTNLAKTDTTTLLRFNTFRDVSINRRLDAINSELVKRELLNKLPIDVRKVFVDAFLNPTSEKLLKLRQFFALPETSIVTSYVINHKPSSHKALESLYDKNPIHLVDQYFYNCPAGDAVPDRLQAVIRKVPRWIRKAGRDKREIKIIVPGSGSGQDVIRILKNNPDLLEKCQVWCIDNELSAIEKGKRVARKFGVDRKIKWINNDLMKLNFSHEMDLALLIGILCPLPNKMSVRILRKIDSYCRPGGLIIFSAVSQKMLIEDPVTCFVMDFIKCKMHYKSNKDFKEITKKSGLRQRGFFCDKRKYHHIIVAEKKT